MSNRKPFEMTPDWLRTYKGFENHTDEEAWEAIDSIRQLSDILLNRMTRNDSDLSKTQEKPDDNDCK